LQIFQTTDNINHVGKITTAMSGISRIEARKDLLGMYPTEYVDAQVMKTHRDPVSKSLLEAAYMQTIISVPTARKIRSEALCEQDLDPNYLTDLKKFVVKIETDKEEQYIKPGVGTKRAKELT
jgi:hypothetical protein